MRTFAEFRAARGLLLADLKKQVIALEKDLREQVAAVPEVGSALRAEYDRAFAVKRTAATWAAWRDERVTQAAVAWVLGTVFVRFCEDNGLLPEPFLAAPTLDGMTAAEESQEGFFRQHPAETDRGWVLASFSAIGSTQAGRLLFDERHNAAFQIPVSHDAAKALDHDGMSAALIDQWSTVVCIVGPLWTRNDSATGLRCVPVSVTVPDMNSFLVLLSQVGAEVAVATDPDDVGPRQALLLALHAGVNAPRDPDNRVPWNRFASALAEADRELQAGLRDPVDLVTANVPPIDPVDENGEPLRTNVVVLTRQLSDLYDAAAAAGQGAPWRQIVWAKVAQCLADAADDLE